MARDGDLQPVLDVVSVIAAARPPADGLGDEVLQHLAALIPCDVVSFCDLDVASRVTRVDQECTGGRVTTNTARVPVPDDPFYRYYWTTPMCSYPSRTGDSRSVIMRTDFMSDRQWHAAPMYLAIFRDDGLDHDMLCCLRNGRARSCRVMFSRSGMSFSERERQLLALLRPALAEGLPPGPAPRPVPLTVRQRELLRHVAAGYTNAEVARHMCLSVHTVRKHLENIYERLQVTSRAAAVARGLPRDEPDGGWPDRQGLGHDQHDPRFCVTPGRLGPAPAP